MRIDSSGNVGIGTSSPPAPLSLGVNANASDIMIDVGNTKYSSLNSSGESKIRFGWYNHAAANIAAYKQTANRTGFKLYTELGFNIENLVLTIDADGNLLVGETSSNPYGGLTTAHVFTGASSTGGAAPFGIYNSSGTANVPVLNLLSRDASTDTTNRFLQFYANVTSSTNTAMGGIVGNGASNVQFASISDVREKENITTISGSLSKITSLNPVEFDWIASGEHCKAGFVAQEVEEVFPEFVVENMAGEGAEERKGLTGGMTGGIVAHLVKAIQEQQETITALTARIEQLENN
jgi:hypothetical protein